MSEFVQLFKDGDTTGIMTTARDPERFMDLFCEVLGRALYEHFHGDEEFQLRHFIPQAFEVWAALNGDFTADVLKDDELVRCGVVGHAKQRVFG